MANLARKARDWSRNEGREARLPLAHRSSSYMPALPVSYFEPFSNFFLDMDRMFNKTFRNLGTPALAGMQTFNPKLDITSDDNEYTVTCEVPGMEEKDIRLDVSADGVLTISGEKRQESSENRKDVHCTECSYGTFERSLTLPDDADQDNIEASFKNGILTITCPRMEMAKRSHRQIQISKGSSAGNANERSISGQGPKKAA